MFPKEISSAIAEHLKSQNRQFKVPFQPEEDHTDHTDLRVQLKKILIDLKFKEKLKKDLGLSHKEIVAQRVTRNVPESPKPEVTIKLNRKIDVIT